MNLLTAILFYSILLPFSLSENQLPVISKAESQSNLLTACMNVCVCMTSMHKLNSTENITWSGLLIMCNSLEKLHKIFSTRVKMTFNGNSHIPNNTQLTDEKTIAPEVQDIIDNNSNENRTFEIISVIIDQDGSPTFQSTNKVNDDYYYLKYITRLTINGKSCMKIIKAENFLQNFANLYELQIYAMGDKTLDIELVDFSNLFKLDIQVINNVNLYCAYENELCLSNPKGLSTLNLHFFNIKDSSTNDGLHIYGKMELPKKIENYHLWYEVSNLSVYQCDVQTNKKNQTEKKYIFEDIEFQTFTVKMPFKSGDKNDLIKTLLKVKDTIAEIKVLKEITIEGDIEIVNSLIIKVYELGLQNKLVLQVSSEKDKVRIPILYAPHINLDESQFTKCKYGEKILKNSDTEVYVDKSYGDDIAIIRSFHLKLSQILNLNTFFFKSKIIQVYSYNIEIDMEPYQNVVNIFKDDFEKIKFIVYYVNIGATNTFNGLYNDSYSLINSSKRFHYNDHFNLQFVSMKSFDSADPIFTRAITTCLILNIGFYHKSAPSKLLRDNQELSTWYDIIKNSREYKNPKYNALDISRSHSAFKYLQNYILLSDDTNSKITRVPFLSLQVLTENIQILAQAGRDIRDKSRHLKTLWTLNSLSRETLQAIGDSKISILKASMEKSISLGEIEKRKQKDIEKQWNQTELLIDYLTKEFEKFKSEVETETVNFKNGVILATTLAVAEAAAEAVNCIIGIFSGGFNPAKALNSARKVGQKLGQIIPKMIKVMRAIKILIDKRKLLGTTFNKVKSTWRNMGPKLTNFFKKQKNALMEWYDTQKKDDKWSKDTIEFFKKEGTAEKTKEIVENTISFTKAVRTLKIGYDVNTSLPIKQNDVDRLATIQEAIKQFENPDADDAMSLGQNLSSVDVFKWTIAEKHVTGMLDSTLSNDVPEATSYRTALFKLIKTGETKTQATLDQAMLETSFSASCFAWGLYVNESVSIGNEILNTEDNLKDKNESDLLNEIKKSNHSLYLDIEWEQLSIKLELVRLNEEYCNAYYYFHLEKCEDDLRINPSDDLEKILSIQNILLYYSNSKLQNLFPPPQTFTDLTITIKKPKYCQCFKDFDTTEISSEIIERKEADVKNRKRVVENKYENVKECLINNMGSSVYDNLKINTNITKETTSLITTDKLKERQIANNILDNCINSTIENVKKSKQFVYKVDVDSLYFMGHERVRIDEVKVIFKGAKTTNGILKIYAESTGVSEDRYKDQCFKFIGDRWIRLLSYYSESAVLNNAGTVVNKKTDSSKFAIILKEIMDQFATFKKEQTNQITFIDTANIHKKFEGLFTSPTVFTTWSFLIPEKINPGLYLEDLEEIELKFSGSFITTDYNKEIVQCKVKDDEEIEATSKSQKTQAVKKLKKKIKIKRTKAKLRRKIKQNKDR